MVDDLARLGVEEEREVDAGEDQDDEAVEGELADHERPVVGEHLVERGASFGATAHVEYSRGYPVTCNTPEQTTFMASVAAEVAGEGAVDVNFPPVSTSRQ